MKRIVAILALTLCLTPLRGQKYEFTLLGEDLVISGENPIQVSDTTAFVNAMLWTADKAGKGKDNIISCSWKNFKAEILLKTAEPGHGTYSAVLSFRVEDGLLSYMVRKVKKHPVSGIKIGVDLEMFYPPSRPSQTETLNEATLLIGNLLDELEAFVAGNVPDIDWGLENAIAQKTVRGMTKDECLLAAGKPLEVSVTGKKETWRYDDGRCLIFESGRLKTTL